MSMEMIKKNVNIDDYFGKMRPEDSAVITTMCLNKLTRKVKELKDLYTSLAKTYSVEMGLCDITLLVQVSSPLLPGATQGVLGTSKGIKHASTILSEKCKVIEEEEEEEDNNG